MYYVYMIKNTIDQLYIGLSADPKKRLYLHNHARGANYTKNNNDFSIVFLEQYSDLASARKREIQLKKWRRDKKEMLIERYKKRLSTY
jgi:putative endonuclease